MGQTTERIEALRALIDRLDSPDLTLVESKVLRCRLLALTGLDLDQEGYNRRAATPASPSEDRPDGPWSPGCRNCAA